MWHHTENRDQATTTVVVYLGMELAQTTQCASFEATSSYRLRWLCPSINMDLSIYEHDHNAIAHTP
jgi:hypothetical protein